MIHLYQQVNDSGPASSLSSWKVIMLSRNLNDGTANFAGLSNTSATYLGGAYLDLHGYAKPSYQGVFGAAAFCDFNGSTGGRWPDGLWPTRNGSSNFVAGTLVGDQPTYATALLNYGPSWQYNPVSENTLPGGSVVYIANNTSPNHNITFPDVFASYIRNQWALMAYSITPQSGRQVSLEFDGIGPSELFITLTSVAILPLLALVIGLLFTIRAAYCTIGNRSWVSRVQFDSWWLIKALRPDLYRAGCVDVTEEEFYEACKGFSLALDRETGYLYTPAPHYIVQ